LRDPAAHPVAAPVHTRRVEVYLNFYPAMAGSSIIPPPATIRGSLVEFVWRPIWPVTEWIGLLVIVKSKIKHYLVDVGAEILPQYQQSLVGTSGK